MKLFNKHKLSLIPVSDGKPGKAIQEHKFVITLVPVNNKAPRFLSKVDILHVSQGGSVPIGQSSLNVFDEDTPITELNVTLARTPHNGKLEKVEGAKRITINQGMFFVKINLCSVVFYHQFVLTMVYCSCMDEEITCSHLFACFSA